MGPTASGKSALAVQLAQHLNGEIISVDSALVYKGMDIGTAKPTMEQRAGITHHLIDILEPYQVFSTGQFREQALTLMAEICQRGKLPILVGGTMLYFSALSNGLAVLPKADPALREKLDQDLLLSGKAVLYQRLLAVDPQSAARIHPNDPQRIQRALEVYELSGKPLSSFFSEAASQPIPFQVIKLIVVPTDRKQLHITIAQRFQQMLDDGLVDEVLTLYRRGDLTENMPAIRAVGYRQVWSYLESEYDYATMIEKAVVATRQLAKRQFTWLRKEDDAIRLSTDQADLLFVALSELSRQIENKQASC